MQRDPEKNPEAEAAQRPIPFLFLFFWNGWGQRQQARWECGKPARFAGFQVGSSNPLKVPVLPGPRPEINVSVKSST